MGKVKQDPNKERKEALTKAVNELQKVFEFEPAMKPKGESEMGLEKMIKEAVDNIDQEADQEELAELSEDTLLVLKEFGITSGEEEEEAEEEEPEEEEEEEEEEEQEEEEEEPAEKKPKAEKKPVKEKAPKKDAGPSFASFMDERVAEGGTFEELAAAGAKEYDRRGTPKNVTVGSIKSHINFRNKDGKWLKDRQLTLTEEGVTKGGSSEKKVEKKTPAPTAKKKAKA